MSSVTTFSHMVYVFLASLLHVVYIIAHTRPSETNPGSTRYISAKTPGAIIALPYSSTFPFSLPGVFISVIRNNVTDRELDIIRSCGMMEFSYGSSAFMSFRLDRPTMANIASLSELLSSPAMSDEDAPNPYISIQNYESYVLLVTKVYQVTVAISTLRSNPAKRWEIVKPSWKMSQIGKHSIVDLEEGESTATFTEDTEFKEVDDSTEMWYLPDGTELWVGLDSGGRVPTRVHGSADMAIAIANSPDHSNGILVPYESDFSNPDLSVIYQFVTKFGNFFGLLEKNDVIAAWREDIHMSPNGQWLAHMMVSLMLSFTGNSIPFFLIRPDGKYDGAVLFGDGEINSASTGTYSAIPTSDLVEEIKAYNFHTSVLTRIARRAGLMVPVDTITSMRILRRLIVPGIHLPDGATINDIQRLLPHLSFDQRPLTGNLSDFELLFPILADPQGVIPEDIYLHHESFFSTDRDELIWASFGSLAPTFQLGSTKVKVSATISARASKDMANQTYTGTPPTLLQQKLVPLSAAVLHWRNLMNTGVVALKTDTKINGARSYNGQEKKKVWDLLNVLCSTTVPRAGLESTLGQGTGSSADGQGRKRQFDGDDAEVLQYEASRKKKRMTMFS